MMKESKLVVDDKTVVVPGDVVAEGMEYLPGAGTYRHEDFLLANQLGVLSVDGKVLKIMPLATTYLPKENDIVIGKVIDILMSGWRIDMNGAYVAMLPLQEASFDFIKKGADLTEYFELGDFVLCGITRVTSQNLIDITMKGNSLRKLKGGHFVMINSARVPRVIGRKGSMVGLLKYATGCDISVGQNGIVWIAGDPEQEVIAKRAVEMIDKQAHVSGLTDRVKAFLEKETGKEINMTDIPEERPPERNDRPRGPPRRDGPHNNGPRHNGPRRDGQRPGRFRRPREESFKRG